jgi:type IV fimbrial biogenesis protein FimT
MIARPIRIRNRHIQVNFSRKITGFTLVELLVTIAIAAIILMVAVPSMSNLLRAARLSTQTDQLIASLQLARLEAIKSRTNVSICPVAVPNSAVACSPTSNAAEIALAKTYWNNGWIVFGGGSVIKRVETNSGVTVDSVSAPMKIDFSGTLGSASVSGQFQLCSKGEFAQKIDFRLSGSVGKFLDNASVCP